MILKFDISRVVEDHWSTLRNNSNGKFSYIDLAAQYLLPALATIIYIGIGPQLTQSEISDVNTALIAAFSIFAALLFNLEVILFGFARGKSQLDPENEDEVLEKKSVNLKSLFVREIFFNVSYAILIAIVLITLSMIAMFFNVQNKVIIITAQFYFVCHFIIVAFVILKRTHLLFIRET